MLGGLLRDLGYEAHICGCDMETPDVHLVNLVTLDDRDYLVDVGFAAPLRHPMPLDEDHDQTVELGTERWVLRPRNADGRSRFDHFHGDEIIHGYTIKPEPRRLSEFATVVDHSFRPEAPFLSRLRAVRHRPDQSVMVRDATVTAVREGVLRERTLPHRTALRDVLTILLGIPPHMLDEAMNNLTKRSGFWQQFPDS